MVSYILSILWTRQIGNHLSSEIFPKSLGYVSFRQDREADTCGGGVFILVKDTRVIFYVRRIGLYLYKYRIYGTISIYILKGLAFVYQLI